MHIVGCHASSEIEEFLIQHHSLTLQTTSKQAKGKARNGAKARGARLRQAKLLGAPSRESEPRTASGLVLIDWERD